MASTEDLFQRAIVAFGSGDLSRAEKLTLELLDLDNKYAEGWSLLASIYQQQEEFDKAIEPAKRATELNPSNIQYWNTLGYLYLRQERWEEGEKSYAKAATMENAPPTIFLNHAWALAELDREDAALKQLTRALEQSLEDTISETILQNDQYTKLRPLLKKTTK